MIDLDELERKATAAVTAHAEFISTHAEFVSNSNGLPPARSVERWIDALTEHRYANNPNVTIKLVARIRELENALGVAEGSLRDRSPELANDLEAILEKGIP